MTKTIYINEVMDGNTVLIGGDDLHMDYLMKSPDEDVEITIGGITYSLKNCIKRYHDTVSEVEKNRRNDYKREELESERVLDSRIAKDIVSDLKNDLYHLSIGQMDAKFTGLNKKMNDISRREHKPIFEIFQLAGEDWAMFDTIKQAIYKINMLERRLDKKGKEMF